MADRPSGRLDGKTALITGGSSGIGAATAQAFAAEGATVLICDVAERAGTRLAEALGPQVHFVTTDVTVPESFAGAVAYAVRSLGGLHVLVNNAGGGAPEGSIVDCDEAVFDRSIAVNLKSVWWGIKLTASHLAAHGGGSIISVASVSASMGLPGQAAYSAAKAGVLQLTRAAAVELARHRTRVNAICPGNILTPLTYNNPSGTTRLKPALLRDGLAQAQPLPQAGEPADVAQAAVFLASDQSAFITGQAITVDGGLSIEGPTSVRELGRLSPPS